jgi:hypothetical protein
MSRSMKKPPVTVSNAAKGSGDPAPALRYGVKESALILRLSPRSVGYRIADGTIATVKDGSRTFILAKELDRYSKKMQPAPLRSKPKAKDDAA